MDNPRPLLLGTAFAAGGTSMLQSSVIITKETINLIAETNIYVKSFYCFLLDLTQRLIK